MLIRYERKHIKKTIDAKKEETCKLFDARAIAQMMCHFSSWWNTSTCSIRVGLISRKLKLDVIFSRIHSVDSNQLKCCQIWIQYRWILKLSCVVALQEIFVPFEVTKHENDSLPLTTKQSHNHSTSHNHIYKIKSFCHDQRHWCNPNLEHNFDHICSSMNWWPPYAWPICNICFSMLICRCPR